jgi:hypothetical protein
MTINKFALAIAVAALAIQAAADQQEPFYWMKKFPDAPPAQVARCMAVAEAAYEKAGGTQGRGENGFSVLAMGTAWEKCMTGG